MTDYTELKRLAEACGNLNWRFLQENWTEYAIRDDHGYIATMRVKSAKQPGPDSDREVKAKFLGAMTPTVVLELIAENDRFKSDLREMTKFKEHMVELRETHGFDSWAAALVEVDRLRVENDALRIDADRLRSATAFVQKLCDSAGKQPSVATGYLHDILSAMGKDGRP